MPNYTNDLREALKLTGAMLQAAEKGEWDALQMMDEERRRLVEAWVAHKEASVDRESATAMMNEMISLNQQMQQLAIAAKQQLMDDFKGIRKKRAATDAYSKCP
ncbi:MAG: flagellar protein FliT [Candidatus Sedimenticola sp. (ex Thyasira tokunagai)]